VSCPHNPGVCESCSPPLLVSMTGTCTGACLPGEIAIDSHCSRSQTSSGVGGGTVAGIVIGSLCALAILSFVVFRRRLQSTRSDLMHKLLTSQEEGAHSHTSLSLLTPVMQLKEAWVVSPSELLLGPAIGEGAFGVVRRGDWRGLAVAVKIVRQEQLAWDGGEAANLEAEAGFMRTVRHPHIVLFFGFGKFDNGATRDDWSSRQDRHSSSRSS
jgi:hypothetical protein